MFSLHKRTAQTQDRGNKKYTWVEVYASAIYKRVTWMFKKVNSIIIFDRVIHELLSMYDYKIICPSSEKPHAVIKEVTKTKLSATEDLV